MENQTPVQIDSLSKFLEICKKESEFVKIATFKNSVIVHFTHTIYSGLFDEIKKLPNKVMLYHSTDFMSGDIELCLFIYKTPPHEFD